MDIIIIIIFFLLLLVVAILLSKSSATALILGGAAAAMVTKSQHHLCKSMHPLGMALYNHAHTLNIAQILNDMGIHDLSLEKYGPKLNMENKKIPAAIKPWTKYSSWHDLESDEGALNEYFEQRASAINEPEFDWSKVFAMVNPKLQDNYEYIGIINVEKDGKTLFVECMEASPIEAGSVQSETTFASVPSDLVAKYADKPALFMFHTHPADIRGSPLPSSHDISTAIYFGATVRFAASVVISRYGALVYTIDWDGYKAITGAKDVNLALSNFSHDVVAAHESIRSWARYTLSDYINFYKQYRLMFVAFPSSEMVADQRRFTYFWSIEAPIDHEIIDDHKNDIIKHKEKINKMNTSVLD